MSDKMIALEIIEYFGAEEMVNNNTPFEEQDYAEAIEELEDLENSTCNWYQDEEDSSDFSSDCGVQFTFNEGMPSENYMKFCCKCGKKLIEHKYDVDYEI